MKNETYDYRFALRILDTYCGIKIYRSGEKRTKRVLAGRGRRAWDSILLYEDWKTGILQCW